MRSSAKCRTESTPPGHVGVAQLSAWTGDRIATLEKQYLHPLAEAEKAEAAFDGETTQSVLIRRMDEFIASQARESRCRMPMARTPRGMAGNYCRRRNSANGNSTSSENGCIGPRHHRRPCPHGRRRRQVTPPRHPGIQQPERTHSRAKRPRLILDGRQTGTDQTARNIDFRLMFLKSVLSNPSQGEELDRNPHFW